MPLYTETGIEFSIRRIVISTHIASIRSLVTNSQTDTEEERKGAGRTDDGVHGRLDEADLVVLLRLNGRVIVGQVEFGAARDLVSGRAVGVVVPVTAKVPAHNREASSPSIGTFIDDEQIDNICTWMTIPNNSSHSDTIK